MPLLHRIESFLDMSLFRKGFLILSAGILPLVFVDGLWIEFKRTPQITSPLASMELIDAKKAFEPLEFYESVFDRDTLFGKVSKETNAVVSAASISELAKDFRLKGVILAGEPEAIVEDARTQKTSFVKAGEKVGELDVKKIEEGRMKLGYADEEMTLEIQS